MPRVSREQTDTNRLAIEEVSARLFKERGFNGVSVADLMAAAGLTHGGFYGHFASKDALAAVACSKSFEVAEERWKHRIAGKATPAEALTALVEPYLSPESRERVGKGCPMSALIADVAREAPDKPVRQSYVAGVKALLVVLQSIDAAADAPADPQVALARMATLVGAMALARATRGDAISDAFLDAGRAHLIGADAAPDAPKPARSRARKTTH